MFCGDALRPFLIPPWQTVDDRVRGGSSISNLEALSNNGALFSGNLNTTTLGGAGFASQFSQEVDDGWDLSAYAGILIKYCEADGKTYTVIIKDEPREEQRQDGREKAGLSWESHFDGKKRGGQVCVKWDDFKPVYRGKEQEKVRKIKVGEVHKFGLMVRR